MVLVMDSSIQVETQGTPSGGTVHPRGLAIPLTRLLLSLAVAALVAVIILFLVIGRGLSNRVNDLERDNASLAVNRLGEDSQVLDSILQLRVISYWLAYPTSEVLLEPPSGTGNSQGVMRTADDGLSAMLMVAGMQELPFSSAYEVWLVGGEQKVQVSQLTVNTRGWGATTFYLVEPIFEFDTVEVTTPLEGGPGFTLNTKVLEGKIGRGISNR